MNTPLRFERFYSFCFLAEKVALPSMLGISTHLLFDAPTFCVGAFAVEVRICVTRGIAGSTGISSFAFFKFWRSEKWHQIAQLRREEYHEFTSFDVQLVLGVCPQPITALLSIDIDDITSGQIVSGLDVI